MIYNNQCISNKKKIADSFCEHFAKSHTAFVPLNNAHDRKIEREFSVLLDEQIEAPENLFKFDDVTATISALRKSKAPGRDGVTNVMIKKLPTAAVESILKIFNRCYKLSYWPAQFKTAIVVYTNAEKTSKKLILIVRFRYYHLYQKFLNGCLK